MPRASPGLLRYVGHRVVPPESIWRRFVVAGLLAVRAPGRLLRASQEPGYGRWRPTGWRVQRGAEHVQRLISRSHRYLLGDHLSGKPPRGWQSLPGVGGVPVLFIRGAARVLGAQLGARGGRVQ